MSFVPTCKADEFLRDCWLNLRNDASPVACAWIKGAIAMAVYLGILSNEQAELWNRRIQTCPGHDDEGGRDWCAYCGKMDKDQEGKEHPSNACFYCGAYSGDSPYRTWNWSMCRKCLDEAWAEALKCV